MWCSAIGYIVMVLLSLFGAPRAAEAQSPLKVPRIGFLMPLLTPERAQNLEVFRHRLRELGWIEGQNVALELRYAEEGTDTARLPDLAADLVRLNVDVIVTLGGTTRIAQSATRTIPIVMVEARDPVEAGFVTSLAQPGGNITGLAGLGEELSGKRLEILKQVVPQLSRVALLLNPTLESSAGNVRETQMAAQALGVALQVLEVRRPEDIEGAFAAVPQAGAGALLLLPDPRVLESHRHHVVALALQSGLPAMLALQPQTLSCHAGHDDRCGWRASICTLSLATLRQSGHTERKYRLPSRTPSCRPRGRRGKFDRYTHLKTRGIEWRRFH